MVRAGCSNASFRPQFVTELQAADLEKLKLPSEFVMHIEEEAEDRPLASVLSPLRQKPWMIRVSKDHSGTFFKRGWHEFSKFHKLEAGFNLVFRYEGNMIFTVKVFNLNGCLKNYSQDAPANLRRIGFDDSRNKKSSENSASIIETRVPSSSGTQKRRKHAQQVLKKKRPWREHSSIQGELRITSRSNVRKGAKYVISTSPHTHDTIIGHSGIYNMLHLPKRFGSIPPCNLEKGKITIKNEKQKVWKIQFNTNSSYNNLCGGWKHFCWDNDIRTGDRCKLKITGHNEILVSVSKVAKN